MISAVLALLLAAGSAHARGSLPLELVRDVPLPGGATRFDYQWVDASKRRLYIAHLGADSLLVYDLRAQKILGEVAGLPSVHGVVAAPERHLVFATATGDKTLAIIDDQTLAVRTRVPAGEYPNGLAYDPKTDKVFVSNNSGLGVAVVDVKQGKPLPGIDLGGGAGNTQYDAGSGRIYAAVHKVAVLAEIDPAAGKVVARHPLSGVKSCHGLLIAAGLRLAFAACAGEAVWEVSADKGMRTLGEGFVGPNAHTVAVDPESHQVYFPLESLRGRAVLRIMEPR
jgi:YVTN family beta-propeller protein